MHKSIIVLATLGLAACVGNSFTYVFDNYGIVKSGIGLVLGLENGSPTRESRATLEYESEKSRIRLEELKYEKRPSISLYSVSFSNWADGKKYIKFTYYNNSNNRAIVRDFKIVTHGGEIKDSSPVPYLVKNREIPPNGKVDIIFATDRQLYNGIRGELNGLIPKAVSLNPEFPKYDFPADSVKGGVSYIEEKAISSAAVIEITTIANENMVIASLFWSYANSIKNEN